MRAEPVQMFLNIRLPSVRLPKPVFPDPRLMPQSWRTRRVRLHAVRSGEGLCPFIAKALVGDNDSPVPPSDMAA